MPILKLSTGGKKKKKRTTEDKGEFFFFCNNALWIIWFPQWYVWLKRAMLQGCIDFKYEGLNQF